MLNRFSSWYTVILDLTTRSNVNLYNFITSNSKWTNTNKKLRAFITIPENNTIYGTTGSPAILVPNNFRYFDRVYIIVNGKVSGHAGAIGARGCGATDGSDGGDGGTAIRLQSPSYVSVTTLGSGIVQGGGGGGGGGGGYTYIASGEQCCRCNNGCGNAFTCDGQSGCYVPGIVCAGYWKDEYECKDGGSIATCCVAYSYTVNNCGGNGGSGEGYNLLPTNGLTGQAQCGTGGNGGLFGQNGNKGADGTSSLGGDGGLSGYYIERLGTGTYENVGTGFKGRIL
jgi:hypothetical protein